MKFVSRLVAVVGLLAAVLMVCTGAFAQEFRGTISGQVMDSTGAAIPGASVTVRENSTGTVNQTTSDAAGEYVVPFLLPGTYTVTVKLTGFETVTRPAITLEAQAHPLVNVSLPIGETTQTVTVSSATPLIDQANASVGQVIPLDAVEDLPLDGRTPTTLTELSVGVITTSAPQLVHPFDNNAGNAWSIGGTPNQVSEVLLDGSPDLTLLGALAYAPTQDSVQEVSIRPFDTDASFGHTIGGVINQITKSGTNGLHGSLYEFYQLTNVNANTYFDKFVANPASDKPTPGFHYNQYGLTVGGPVFIPKVYDGRNKLFFFFAWEGLKDSTPATTTLTVPTAAERGGDFSALLAAPCGTSGYTVSGTTGVATCNNGAAETNQLYNPYTATTANGKVVRTAIPNNNLLAATAALNPVALAYLNLLPQANNVAGASSTGVGNYISNAPSVDDYNNEFGRLDYNASSRDHLFGDFRHNFRSQVKNDYFGTGVTGTTLVRENFGLTIDNVYTLNPTTIFDTRVNWTLFNEFHGTPAQKYSPATVGLSGLAANSTEPQLPYINFLYSGSTSCGSTTYQCFGDTGSALDPTTSYQVFADMVKTLGRHTLKVGFDGRQYRLSVQNFGDSSGLFAFNTSFVNSGSSGNTPFGGDLAAFLLGLPSSGEYDIAARQDIHQYYTGSFVQDDWRVNDKLTVNLGLRYDVDTPFREKNSKTLNGFNPAAVNSLTGSATSAFTPQTVTANGQTFTLSSISTTGGATYPTSATNGALYNTNNGFVSPRVGFSYSPTSRVAVRGGFGIFVQPEGVSNLNSSGTTSSNALSYPGAYTASTQYSATSNNYQTSNATLSNPFPNGVLLPQGSAAGANTNLGQGLSFFAPNEHDPYSERWNLGTQYSLTSHTLLEALYVGNHSLHLPVGTQNINATETQFLTTNPYRNSVVASQYGTSVTNPYAGQLPNSASCNGATVALSVLLTPFPQFCGAAVSEVNQTIGSSNFNSVILHVEQRKFHGLYLTANYSFSKLLESDTFLNDEDNHLTYRVSPFDHTHHFTAGGTYDLPFGRGKMFGANAPRWVDEIIGGFTVNGVYQFQTGAPVIFTSDLELAPGVSARQITIRPRDTDTANAFEEWDTAGGGAVCAECDPVRDDGESFQLHGNGGRLQRNGADGRAVLLPLPDAAADAFMGPSGRVQQPRCIAAEELLLYGEDLSAASL